MFSFIQWYDSGLRSFAYTMHPFLVAGRANGPTPANTSHTYSPGLNAFTRRPCSVCNREFQYTLEKSNLKRQPPSFCKKELLISPHLHRHRRKIGMCTHQLSNHVGISCQDFHFKETESGIDIVDLIYDARDILVFLQPFFSFCIEKYSQQLVNHGLTSKITSPMRCFQGRSSSRRFICARHLHRSEFTFCNVRTWAI